MPASVVGGSATQFPVTASSEPARRCRFEIMPLTQIRAYRVDRGVSPVRADQMTPTATAVGTTRRNPWRLPFKAYDVRGIYGDDVTEDLAYQVGRAFIAYTGTKKVIMGRDMRESGITMSQALIRGLTEAGADVEDIGLASTDMMYFAVIDREADGGIAVTASHNPAKYNGLKCVREKAIPMGLGSGLEEIESRLRSGNLGDKAATPGKVTTVDVLDDFVAFMHSFVPPSSLKPLKVIIDAGNGMGGLILPKLFANTPVQVTPLFYELDGNFPNHEANPLLKKRTGWTWSRPSRNRCRPGYRAGW